MADDKKKDADAKGDGGKKKGMPAIVLVAVGAALGGAGVVFAVPAKKVEVRVEKPAPKIQPLRSDPVDMTFNPLTDAGKGFASLKFKYVFEMLEGEEEQAKKLIEARWDSARSDCLIMLGSKRMNELQTESGKRVLCADLLATLDKALFPEDGHKFARVTGVYLVDIILQ